MSEEKAKGNILKLASFLREINLMKSKNMRKKVLSSPKARMGELLMELETKV